MATALNVINYWRNCLADTSRMEIPQGRLEKARFIKKTINVDFLPEKDVKALFKEKEAELKRNSQRQTDENQIPDITTVNVLISPIRIVQKLEHTKTKYGSKKSDIHPMWIPAQLNEDGRLKPPDDLVPWMVRTVLEPVQEDSANSLVLGTVDAQDKYLSLHKVPTTNWDNYVTYCRKMFKYISGATMEEIEFDEFVADTDITVILDKENFDFTVNIFQLYDHLRESKEIPPLLSNFTSLTPPPLRDILNETDILKQTAHHVGQMGNQFPLSVSQRQALSHFAILSDGEVLAVNGPPGTGKTTLLQSIVANSVVQSAIKGEEPAVIAVSSTNNQAIENVIESFGKTGNSQELLTQRWIPDINSFALFLPAGRKEISEGVHYFRYKSDGLPNDIERIEFLESAKKHFLEQCGQFLNHKPVTVQNAVQSLHTKLMETVEEIGKCPSLWLSLDETKNELADYIKNQKPEEYIEALKKELNKQDQLVNQWEQLRSQWLSEMKSESIFTRLLMILGVKSVIAKRESRYRVILASSPTPADHLNFKSRAAIETFIAESLSKEIKLQRAIRDKLGKVKQLLELLKQKETLWQNWKQQNRLTTDPPDTMNLLDTTLRYRAFYLAVHYWEGRWIEETQDFLGPDQNLKSKEKNKKQWRRYAMLTPCFVSTFHTIPRFFCYSKYRGPNDFLSIPLLDFIDLLIVDEAGQVSPEIAGAAFALAKKALVVGDVYQISPIRKLTYKVDLGNMCRFQIIDDATDEKKVKAFFDTGLSPSKGSLMKIAQENSPFQLPGHNNRGMFLAEHRRCYNEIISYCNQLAYNGKLMPLRGSAKDKEQLFPAMGYANITSHSQNINGSKKNSVEARVVANWLAKHKKEIEAHYGSIRENVGIITPYAAQRNELYRALKDEGISTKDMKIGTIHALQGAERPIVIFVPVYGFDQRNMWFIDQDVNMLNVAVSRAKDSFLVFGNMCLFNPAKNSPSGLLALHLFSGEENELVAVEPPPRTDESKLARIDNLKTHLDILDDAVENAKSEIVIVSPYISINALEYEDFAEKIKKAVGRGITFKVYTDMYLDRRGNKLVKRSEKGRSLLKQCGVELIEAQGIHNKSLWMDDKYLVEGSFNWLSSPRDTKSRFYLHNVSIGYKGEEAARLIRQASEEMEIIAKLGAKQVEEQMQS